MKQEPGNASSQESPGFSRGEQVNSLRSKIARAIYETYREISNMGEPPWEALCGSIREENHLQEADAVLAVIDVDAVRAEAKVKALLEQSDELNRLANTKSLIEAADKYAGYYAGVRAARQEDELLTRGRADRIAREAGIETGADDER